MFKLSLIGLALISAAAVPAAAEPATAVSIVQTADLDLSSEAGREALGRRIARAAVEVCGTASDVDLEGKNAVRHCRDDVVAKASAQREQLLASAERGAVIAIAAR
jgi:UrcA family protein